jgi:hypothetical protein
MRLVVLQVIGVAVVPLNRTLLDPCMSPKFAPLIVTEVPTGPVLGDNVVTLGGGAVTANVIPLLAIPPTVTTTGPVVAPAGTGTRRLVVLQVIGVAVVPLNRTLLDPCMPPKFAPPIVTGVPTGPVGGDKLVMIGSFEPLWASKITSLDRSLIRPDVL